MTVLSLARLSAVTKRFQDGTHALEGIDLEIQGGELLGLVGSNGSGKTTLLRILAGASGVTSGELYLFGQPIQSFRSRELRRRIGFVSQDPALDPEMTAEETLRLFSVLYAIPRSEKAARIDQVITGMNLQDFLPRPVARLSGGQRQRLHLAISLLQQPSLLLLDEPTNALDPNVRAQFWKLLRSFVTPETAVVVATHNLGEAEEHFDRLAILSRGVLVTIARPKELLSRPGLTLEKAFFDLTGEDLNPIAQASGPAGKKHSHPRRNMQS
ncbi:MAG TPA: ABC transporter ATP-binding protein [Bdellovibrionota bacterium]|nr:ABC transporter ATP-binding protein [Bdellovibrionota bacterium]